MPAQDGIGPELAERLCIDAIDAVELVGLGSEIVDITSLGDDSATLELVRGLVLYANLLEASICVLRTQGMQDSGISAVREAARQSAGAWRKRVAS